MLEIKDIQLPFKKLLDERGEKYVWQQSCKATSAEPGIPDFIILSGLAPALCIEVKLKGKKPSPVQREWHEAAAARGIKVHLCYSFPECVAIYEAWQSGLGVGAAIPPTIDGKPEFITKFQTRFRLQPDGSYSPYAPAN